MRRLSGNVAFIMGFLTSQPLLWGLPCILPAHKLRSLSRQWNLVTIEWNLCRKRIGFCFVSVLRWWRSRVVSKLWRRTFCSSMERFRLSALVTSFMDGRFHLSQSCVHICHLGPKLNGRSVKSSVDNLDVFIDLAVEPLEEIPVSGLFLLQRGQMIVGP